jgi:hypothetical protein
VVLRWFCQFLQTKNYIDWTTLVSFQIFPSSQIIIHTTLALPIRDIDRITKHTARKASLVTISGVLMPEHCDIEVIIVVRISAGVSVVLAQILWFS